MKPLLLALTVALCACRQEEVTRTRVPKEEGEAPPMASFPALPAAAPASVRLRWTVPTGWMETSGTGMRVATITPPGPGKAEVTVVALPGDSGGELENANRWRGQIGLGPTDATGLAASRAAIRTKLGPASTYSFSAGGSRLVAAVVSYRGVSWFIKLMGQEDAVKRAEPGFRALLESVAGPAT